MLQSVTCLLLAAAIIFTPLTAMAVDGQGGDGRATYRNSRFGFEFSYPSGLLIPEPGPGNDAGRVFRSRDGRAKLLAAAGDNAGNDTLEAYRRFLITESYRGARLDYAPVRPNWFVLSGTRGDEMFYERVTFACGGRLIYGWQLTYPVAERAIYDRVVEAIHRSYRAGQGEDGTCPR